MSFNSSIPPIDYWLCFSSKPLSLLLSLPLFHHYLFQCISLSPTLLSLSFIIYYYVFKFAFNYNYFMLSFFALIFLSFFLSSSVGRIPFVSLYLLFYLSNYFLFCFNIPLKPYISIIFWPLPFYHLLSISLKFV